MRKVEIDRKFDEIVDFRCREVYRHTVKRYSSGMRPPRFFSGSALGAGNTLG